MNLLSKEEEGAADTLEDYRYSDLLNLAFVLFVRDLLLLEYLGKRVDKAYGLSFPSVCPVTSH